MGRTTRIGRERERIATSLGRAPGVAFPRGLDDPFKSAIRVVTHEEPNACCEPATRTSPGLPNLGGTGGSEN